MVRKHYDTTSHKIKRITASLIALLLLAATGLAIGLHSHRAGAQQAHFPLNSVVATTTILNLRDQPAMSGATVVTMPANAMAMVIGGPFNDSWYWLDYNGTFGYALGRYLTPVNEKYTPVPAPTPTTVPAIP